MQQDARKQQKGKIILVGKIIIKYEHDCCVLILLIESKSPETTRVPLNRMFLRSERESVNVFTVALTKEMINIFEKIMKNFENLIIFHKNKKDK